MKGNETFGFHIQSSCACLQEDYLFLPCVPNMRSVQIIKKNVNYCQLMWESQLVKQTAATVTKSGLGRVYSACCDRRCGRDEICIQIIICSREFISTPACSVNYWHLAFTVTRPHTARQCMIQRASASKSH